MHPQWQWQQQYQVALLETNPLHLGGRVANAERVISLRAEALRMRADGQAERTAIEYAMRGLSVLKREIPAIR
ncbi:MAG TPA: hypothetical protein VN881_14875 [Candidatus Acidoferrales bacterium]|jgi:hypothetical protein|nr:hypothetical protein [Candidatus Acidoferrales bacterium]